MDWQIRDSRRILDLSDMVTQKQGNEIIENLDPGLGMGSNNATLEPTAWKLSGVLKNLRFALLSECRGSAFGRQAS
ncbi:MAG TPA: hypothetical protein VH280_17100 [Verrucomicrobiae bacterium]|jgi:hypothetical protein|nr:hypothetical protein [Verrucomicrobiae bacterium]